MSGNNRFKIKPDNAQFLVNGAPSDMNMHLRILQLECAVADLQDGLLVVIDKGTAASAEAAITTVPNYASMIIHVNNGIFKVLSDEMNENTKQFYVKDLNNIYWIPTQTIQ